jgi:hypothetical protein
MTALRISIGSALKILSTALVVTTTFATSLLARENLPIDRCVALSVRPNVPRHIEGLRWIPGAAASAMAPALTKQPGGVCDVGDNPMIC